MKLLSLTITAPGGGNIAIQGANGQPTGGLSELIVILKTGIALLILFAIILSLFSLIYLGFQWIFSGGDKQKIQSARQRFNFIIVGLVVVLLSFAIVSLLGTFFQINFLSLK